MDKQTKKLRNKTNRVTQEEYNERLPFLKKTDNRRVLRSSIYYTLNKRNGSWACVRTWLCVSTGDTEVMPTLCN